MSQVIVRRKSGQQIPEAFLTAALAACPTAWGIARVQDGKLEINHGEKITVEDIRATEENFDDFTLVLVESKAGVNLNDVPPFELAANQEDEPVVAVCIDGEFPGFHKEKSSHPAIYHLADFISDRVLDLLDNVDGDVAKAMEKIGGDRFKDKIKMNSVSRGYLTFISDVGKDVTIMQGDTAKEYPWGWVSQTFGWDAEEKKEEEPVEKPKGLFKKKSASTTREKHVPPSNNVALAGADKAPKTATAIPKDTNTGSNNPTKEEKPKPVILSVENITIKKMKCPSSFSRRARKAWFKERLGHIPPTWQNPDAVYEVYVSPTGAILTKKEIKNALGMSAAALKPLDNPKAERPDDLDVEHMDIDRPVPNPLPILSKNGRDRMHRLISDERIKKIISENSVMITDPDRVQNHEAKIPLFASQLGMKDMADFDCFPFVELERIGRNDIHDLATLAWTWKCRALAAEHKLGKAKPVKAEAEKEETIEQEKPVRTGLFKKRAAA